MRQLLHLSFVLNMPDIWEAGGLPHDRVTSLYIIMEVQNTRSVVEPSAKRYAPYPYLCNICGIPAILGAILQAIQSRHGLAVQLKIDQVPMSPLLYSGGRHRLGDDDAARLQTPAQQHLQPNLR